MTIEPENIYELDGELTTKEEWEYSRKLRENDSLIVKNSWGNFILHKDGLYDLLQHLSLPERIEFHKELKQKVVHYMDMEMEWQVEDAKNELKEFWNGYICIPGNKDNKNKKFSIK